MSIRKAHQFYQELTPQQKHFVDNKTINTTLSVKHWIAFLRKASDFDEYCDKARQALTLRMVFLVLGIIASVILAFSAEFYYLLVLPVVLVLMLVNAAQTRSQFARHDLNNYLRLFFMPFLEAIKNKAGEEAKLSASLDFRDPFKSVTPQKYDYKFKGSRRDVKLYEPKMIIAGVTLSDGSYLETVLLDEIRSISYSNANGKSKSKTKTLHRLFIRLSVSKNLYKRKGSLPENITVSEEGDNIIFKLKEKSKEDVYGVLQPSVFFTALSTLYKYLDPIRGASMEGLEAGSPQPAETLGVSGSRLVEALVWDDVIFSNYDYDSASMRGRGWLAREDDSQNIFDS